MSAFYISEFTESPDGIGRIQTTAVDATSMQAAKRVFYDYINKLENEGFWEVYATETNERPNYPFYTVILQARNDLSTFKYVQVLSEHHSIDSELH